MRKILIIILTAVPLWVTGQNLQDFIFKSPSVSIVEFAIQDAFCIIEQSYQLEDKKTNQRFGRYGNEVFGKDRTLAIKIGDGILFNQRVLEPWEYDENYSRYRETHQPIPYHTSIIELDDSIKRIAISEDNLLKKTDPFVLLRDSISMKGLRIGQYHAPVEGWFVWIHSDKEINDYHDSCTISYSIYKKCIEFHEQETSYKVDTPQNIQNIWGGIFIIPEQTEIGQITFKVGGVLLYSNDSSSWNLISIYENTDICKNNTATEELTLLNSQKEKNHRKVKSKKKQR